MLKRILLCSADQSASRQPQSNGAFPVNSPRRRLMARKYFTLVVLIALMVIGRVAVAQDDCRCYVDASLMWGGGGTDVNMDPVAVGSYGALPDMPTSSP